MYAPLVAVFLLALLLGFAGRVLLPQQQQSTPFGGVMMSSMIGQASAALQPAVHRRRLIALSSPFRVNPLAGQVNRWPLAACLHMQASFRGSNTSCLQASQEAPVIISGVLYGRNGNDTRDGLERRWLREFERARV